MHYSLAAKNVEEAYEYFLAKTGHPQVAATLTMAYISDGQGRGITHAVGDISEAITTLTGWEPAHWSDEGRPHAR
jgi:hypothetical protein